VTGPRQDGTVQLLTADRAERAAAAFGKEVEYAEKAETHVWIVTVAHRITDDRARAAVTGTGDGPILLDAESVSVSGIGCYRCEQELTQRLIGKRCKGDPRELGRA